MNPYEQVFYPILGAACVIAAIASYLAARTSGVLLPGVLLITGVVAIWAALFVGSDLGYRAWQSIPDPPREAFSDAFPTGAALFGWLPSAVFCWFVFALARQDRRSRSRGTTGTGAD